MTRVHGEVACTQLLAHRVRRVHVGLYPEDCEVLAELVKARRASASAILREALHRLARAARRKAV